MTDERFSNFCAWLARRVRDPAWYADGPEWPADHQYGCRCPHCSCACLWRMRYPNRLSSAIPMRASKQAIIEGSMEWIVRYTISGDPREHDFQCQSEGRARLLADLMWDTNREVVRLPYAEARIRYAGGRAAAGVVI
jgi:hypothetical protein